MAVRFWSLDPIASMTSFCSSSIRSLGSQFLRFLVVSFRGVNKMQCSSFLSGWGVVALGFFLEQLVPPWSRKKCSHTNFFLFYKVFLVAKWYKRSEGRSVYFRKLAQFLSQGAPRTHRFYIHRFKTNVWEKFSKKREHLFGWKDLLS